MEREQAAKDPLKPTIDQLRDRRVRVGLSQARLDELAGFPSGRVSHWESGMAQPSVASLVIWAEALGCRLILGGSPVPAASEAVHENKVISYLFSRHIRFNAST